MLSRSFRFTCLALILGARSHAEDRKDLEYGQADGKRLLLDAHIPEGTGPFPVAILIHGGGWSHGDKAGSDRPGNPADISPWFDLLNRSNFVWFSLNYRLLPAGRWPAGFEDVQTGIAWVKAHVAEYKGDPARIAIFGHSAGGNLAALAAENQTAATRVQAAVLFAPSTDYPAISRVPPTLVSRLQDQCEPPPGMSHEALQVARYPWPIDQVSVFMPPVLLVQGELDRTVPYPRTVVFWNRLRDAGATCDFLARPGAPHSLVEGHKIDPGSEDKVIVWLRSTLDAAAHVPASSSEVTVAADGTGKYKTIQAALDSIPADNPSQRVIVVKEGTYRERVRLVSPHVTLRGESRRSTRIEFASPDGGGTDAAIVTVAAADCALENLSIQSTSCRTGVRSVAVAIRADLATLSDCDVLGEGSDTLTVTAPAAHTRLLRLIVRGSSQPFALARGATLQDSQVYVVPTPAAH